MAKDKNIQIEKLQLGPFGTNAYVLICQHSGDSVLVDAPAEANKITEILKGTKPRYILLTHNHMDHIGALTELRSSLGIPLAAHTADSGSLPSPPEIQLNDGDVVSFGNIKLEVLHTPGHGLGCICLLGQGVVFSGDTLFNYGIGRYDLPGGSYSQLMNSLNAKLMVLPDDTIVYPGHGPEATIGTERRGNPFLRG